MAFQQRRIAVNGITLNVIDEGQGPAVLLLHGFPDDHQVWRQQIPALVAAGYRVIAPDLRGCGDSDAPPSASDYRVSTICADLIGVLDALNLERVALVGHDWGAAIGWFFAMHHADRVTRYAALSVGHPQAFVQGGIAQILKSWYMLFFQLRGIAEWLLRANNWWMFRSFIRQPSEVPLWIARLQRPGRLTAAINYYRGNLAMLGQRRFPSVTIPAMGVWSDGDRFLNEPQMRNSERFVRGTWRYERIEGAGHWMQLDAPERVNALLLDFLRA